MRVLVIGGTGLLGTAVTEALGPSGRGHVVLVASRSSDLRVDLTDESSIVDMYRNAGRIDAVAVAAGSVPMRPISQLTHSDFLRGITNKLLGQIDVVLQGIPLLPDGGSFTLVSGITAHDPIQGGSALSMINSAIDGFVRGAAVDLPRGLRINSVSGNVFREASALDRHSFPGYLAVPVADVAQAFVKSIDGSQTGQTYRVGY